MLEEELNKILDEAGYVYPDINLFWLKKQFKNLIIKWKQKEEKEL